MYSQSEYATITRPLLHWPRLLPWEEILVHEHEFALLSRKGRIVGQLDPGLHRVWGSHVAVYRLDRRRQLLDVPAQETATADGVTLKVTAQVLWQIRDPIAAFMHDVFYHQTLYAAAQQAVRSSLGAVALTALGPQRPAIAAAMLATVSSALDPIGISVHEVVLKDVMPNAETRKAMAAVAFAKQEALAALEKARGEHAALRALANTARLLKDQPELAQVRGWQILAEGFRGGAQIVVTTNGTTPVPMNRKE